MREVSAKDFMSYAVSETHPALYGAWETGAIDIARVDMHLVLNSTALELFKRQETGAVADYVRETLILRDEGAMTWVP